ncbi:hypothetical protein [Desulforhopalus singaporensis]|uniref:Uncharacterized protein n=1 Tax=Desulforhopalus singaporensis TaxID=91360 RepID=A0A1H0LB25_9BACT|nr:hypothetical protein [Desulforhopalus singaporensis]SDO65335.1 hypothetical protein SAMN05660330_00731 [Desulforhopalus singaporensis]
MASPKAILTELMILLVLTMTLCSCATYRSGLNGREITLVLNNPHARQVTFFSSLDNFYGQKLQNQKGLWKITVATTTAFRYFYIIDDNIYLPPCPLQEQDDFGEKNCVFEPPR